MTVAAAPGALQPAPDPEAASPSGQALTRAGRLADFLLLLLPGALTVYFGFRAGGFFPAAPALVALVLAQLLALRAVLAEQPFPGAGRPLAVAAGAMAVLALWTLASGLWSNAEARGLLEFARVLLYLLALVLFGALARRPDRLAWMIRGLALAALVVCGAGLVSRTMPDVLSVAPDLAGNRLGYPATYPNAMGLLSSLGVLMALHLASAPEPRMVKAFAAAALVPLLVTLYFTFSRGAMAAGGAGLVIYLLAARPRGAVATALAAIPPAAVALVAAYHADLLSSADPTTAAAAAQGHHVALVTGIAAAIAAIVRVALTPLDRRLDRARIASPARRRRVVAGAAASGLALLLVVSLALGLPGTAARQYDRFVDHPEATDTTDVRGRLTSLDNGYRLEFWRASLRAFDAAPVKGTGAGTFELLWSRERPAEFTATDGHSLFLETLGELGIVGLLPLLVVLGAFGWGAIRMARGPARHAGGLVLAVVATWAIHAGVDWDWEMPALTIGVFALGGAVLAAAPGAGPRGAPSRDARMLVAVGCLLVAIAPALVYVSQKRLDGAVGALSRGDCTAAVEEARASLSALAARPQPYAILGYCDLDRALPELAVAAMRKAAGVDPESWEMRFALAVAEGAAGRDPRPSARRALALNPYEPLARDYERAVQDGGPAAWRRAAATARTAALESGRLSISVY